MTVLILLAVPIALALCPLVIRRPKTLGDITAAGLALCLGLSLRLMQEFLAAGRPINVYQFIYIDALSLCFILALAIVAFAAALYSTGFIAAEIERGAVSENKARLYYALFNLFIFSMLLVTAVNNLGIMWAAIEMTTVVSAFLVGFYNTKEAVEAAWKYLIICSAGIILALLGMMLFSYAALFGADLKSLNWTELMAVASRLDGNLLKISFIFILVGYGTKAGLAPMHTWLPDAHSQAVSPASALLSGVLIKTALYAILRYAIIVNRCLGTAFTGRLFLIFGLLSLAVAAGFILVQKDIKRLLAYSSIEHLGVIAVGLGIGGPLGTFGALLHILNHAAAKALMFFGAGNIVKKYDTHNMRVIKGVIRTLPFTGIMVLLGLLAVIGSPPFSIFFSEMIILAGAIMQGSYLAAALYLLFLAIAFGALVHHFAPMLFGGKPADMTSSAEPLTGICAGLFLMLVIGLAWVFALTTGPLNQLLISAAALLGGS